MSFVHVIFPPDFHRRGAHNGNGTHDPFRPNGNRLQNLVFPITVTIEKPELVVDGQRITMTPGMAVSAEIKTSSRRILEYLLSPLLEVTSESLRER